MSATKQKNKPKRAIILSIILHCILIAILLWSSLHKPKKSSVAADRSSIDAMMVDPDAVMQQYNRQQQTDESWIQKKHDKHTQKPKAEAKKQLQEVVKQDKVKQQKQVAASAAKAKIVTAEKQRAELEKKMKALVKTKKQAKIEAKKATTADAKAKTNQEIKDKTTAAQKAAAKGGKHSSDVDVLLSILTDAKNEPKVKGTPAEISESKKRVESKAEIDAYKAQVSLAISNKFYNASSYNGKTCDLRIKLMPNGFLVSVIAVGGDPELCQAAVSAAKRATIPKAPSLQVYEIFKNTKLEFLPQ